MEWPRNISETLADQAIRAFGLETRLPRAVSGLRRRLRHEALSCAVDSLYHWVARGVEWFNATCGWIFLVDEKREVLRSLPGASVRSRNPRVEIPLNSPSFMAHVYQQGKGDFTNDVRRLGRNYCQLDARTRSELAVPLFDEDGPEGGKVIAIYNLESENRDTFFPAQVREAQRNAALLTIHLLILRDWHAHRHDHPWVWHPEVHGWSPGKLLERLCRTVARAATNPGEPEPSCSVWNVDPLTECCWTLGTSGYDYEFLNLSALDHNSAAARVSSAFSRAVERGTHSELGFANLAKAERMGLKQAAMVSLNDAEHPVHGTLHIYALDAQTTLPTDRLLVRLAEKTERLLATVNRQRLAFAKAHLRGRLTKSASQNPDFRMLRKALLTVLPGDALSIFVANTTESPGCTVLKCVDGTGFMNPDTGSDVELSQVHYVVKGGGQVEDSLTAFCFSNPGQVVRLNFDLNDPALKRQPRLPQPDPDSKVREKIVVEDAQRRRRMGIGVGDKGVIRILRSGKGRPFTEADERLLQALAASAKCQNLFLNYGFEQKERIGPDLSSPLTTLLEKTLQDWLPRLTPQAKYGRVFLYHDAKRYYRQFACEPRHPWFPEEFLFQREDLIGKQLWRHSQFPVLPCRLGDNTDVDRLCVPLLAWDESHLLRAILAFDFPSQTDLNQDTLHQVFRASIDVAAVLSTNRWITNPHLLGKNEGIFFSEFEKFVTGWPAANVDSLHWEDLETEPMKEFSDLRACPDPDLRTYKVLLSADGSLCQLHMRSGPLVGKNSKYLCKLTPRLTAKIYRALIAHRQRLAARKTGVKAPPKSVKEETSWRELRLTIGLMAGAWARMIAPNLSLWEGEFTKDQTETGVTVWKPTLLENRQLLQ